MKRTLRYARALALTAAALAVVGWTSGPKVVVLPAVGPGAKESKLALDQGLLQVYSARASADVDVNREEFFWNDDFGKNNFLYEPSHTDYTICGHDGQVLQRVHNARNWEDGTPTLVKLPPGEYKVEAQAEESGGITIKVEVPVVIQAGHVTTVRLSGR